MKQRIALLSLLLIVLVACVCLTTACEGVFPIGGCKHESSHWDTEKEADCNAPGIRVQRCDKCGYVLDAQEFGHELVGNHSYKWVIDFSATCENEGRKHEECEFCGECRDSQTIPVLEHEDKNGDCRCDLCSAPAHRMTETPEKLPTCTKAGNYRYWTCDVCNNKFEDEAGMNILYDDGVWEATGHISTEYDETQPTCTTEGRWHLTCNECHQIVEEGTFPKLYHLDNNNDCVCERCNLECHNTVQMQGQQALCMTEGRLEYWQCYNCSKLFLDQDATHATTLQEVHLAALNHDYVGGVCTRCSLKQGTLGLTLEPVYKDGDNTTVIAYAVAGLGEVTDTEIVIPASYNGLPVTTIKAQAFKETNVTKVEIQTSVTKIGQGAFAKCAALQSLILPFVGESASEARSLASQLGWLFENEYFSGCVTVTQKIYYDVPSDSNSMDNKVCMPSTLTSVTVTNNIIPVCAFYGCSTIQEITVGEDVTRIEGFAFHGCSLREFNFNATECSVRDFSWYPVFRASGGSITVNVAANVTKIPNRLFYESSAIKKVEFAPNSVCSYIGEYAFYDCDKLTEINIPSSIQSIGRQAFYWCSSLTRVDIDDISAWLDINIASSGQSNLPYESYANPLYWGHNLYLNGQLLTDLVIPSNITEIKNYAFAGANCLESITFENIGNIVSIGKDAFQFCQNLTGVYLNAADAIAATADWCGVKFYDQTSNPLSYAGSLYVNGVLQTELTFDAQITEINGYTFYGMKGLTTLHLSNALQKIGNHAFYECTDLINYDMVIYNGVSADNGNRVIGRYAFYGCTSLVEGIDWEIIEDYAFYGCEGLSVVNISANTVFIGSGAYGNCSVTKFVVDGNNEYFKAVDNNLYSKNGQILRCFTCGSGATSFEIPQGVTYIADAAFTGANELQTITIPSSVMSIGSAFSGCTSLEGMYITDLNAWCRIVFYDEQANPLVYAKKLYLNGETLSGEIVLEEDITIIPEYTFYGSEITSINIPSSVNFIGKYAFAECQQLQSIVVESDSDWTYGQGSITYNYTLTQDGALTALTEELITYSLTRKQA